MAGVLNRCEVQALGGPRKARNQVVHSMRRGGGSRGGAGGGGTEAYFDENEEVEHKAAKMQDES